MEICMGFLHQFSMVMYKSVLIVCRNVVDYLMVRFKFQIICADLGPSLVLKVRFNVDT